MFNQRLSRVFDWLDNRVGISDYVIPLLTHIVPRNARWWYVFGSATLTAFIVQIASGIALAMAYVPGGGEAFESLKYITEQAPLGSVLRGMHYFGASAMVVLVVIHMMQVFLHATYKFPREMNWMSGVVLLFVVLGMGFTGQLLRWDANGVWSVTVAAEMAGRAPIVGPAIAHLILAGETVGGSTLSRFYVLHVFVLPGLIITGIGLHLLLLFRHGVSEMPNVNEPVNPATYKTEYEKRLKRTGVAFWPHAAWRDIVFSTFVVAIIMGCAIFVGAPSVDHPPDPSSIDANPMPDWYFWWYFAILSMLPASLETWVILGAPVVGFLALFTIPLLSNRGHRAPSKRPLALGVLAAGVVGWAVLTIYGYREPWSPDFGVQPLPTDVVGTSQGEIAEGAKLMHAKGCLYCHNIDGHGGHRGPELTYIGDELTRNELIIRINNGGYNMPAFAGTVTATELRYLVDFLKSRTHQSARNTE